MRRTAWMCLSVVVFLTLIFPITAQQQDENHYTGTIDNDTPYETFPITVRENGSKVIVDIRATSGDLDTLLYLVDHAGSIVAENDDRTEGDFNALIEYPQAMAGDYTIIATRYGVMEGLSSGDFEIMIVVTPPQEDTGDLYAVTDDALIAAGFPVIAPHEEAEWTVIAYYGGDNNLEAGVLNDFKEFELGGGSTDRVRLVMLMDRHPEYSTASGDWATARLFEIGADVSGDEIDTPEMADLGKIDTGSGETLAQYLVWAVQTYPAQHYAIAFSSHGAAWSGLITDDTNGYTILTLPELRNALAAATHAAGVERFDMVITDACLMSSVEYHHTMSNYFLYSLASPEIVVNPALDMSLLVQTLNQVDKVDSVSLAANLIDTYIDRDIAAKGGADSLYMTYAFTDLSAFEAVAQSITRFVDVVQKNPALYSRLLGEARSNAYTYSSFTGGDALIDIGNLMRQVIFLSTDPDLILAAEDILHALSEAVIYTNAGAQVATQTATYHNIYFPARSQAFKATYLTESSLPQWGVMLRSYYNAVTPKVWSIGATGIPFHPPTAPKIHIASIYPTTPLSVLSPLSINLEIMGRNLSYADTTIDYVLPDGIVVRLLNQRLLRNVGRDGAIVRVNQWNSGIETVDIVWDAALPFVTDGTTSSTELLILTEDTAALDGRYHEPDSETWNTVSLIFDINDGSFQRVVNRSEETGAVGVVSIPVGSTFQAARSLVTADGRVVTEPGTVYTWPENGLSWSWEPAPSGTYNIGLLATSFGGTTGFNTTSVTIDNAGVDPALRANIRTTLGFSIARPKDWLPLAIFREESVFRAINAENTQNFTVYFAIQNVPPEPENIAALIVENYGLVMQADPTPITLADGTPAAAFTLTRQAGDRTFTGRAFALYVESLGAGLVFSAETSGDPLELDALYPILRDYITLFDPAALARSNTRQWSFQGAIENTRYPMLKSWQMAETDSAWAQYTPIDAPDHTAFVAISALDITGDSPAALLDAIAETHVVTGVSDFSVVAYRSYTGQNHTWDAASYQAQRDGLLVQGRLYITQLNDLTYAVWVETPDGEDAVEVFATVFEPIIDGFTITAAPE